MGNTLEHMLDKSREILENPVHSRASRDTWQILASFNSQNYQRNKEETATFNQSITSKKRNERCKQLHHAPVCKSTYKRRICRQSFYSRKGANSCMQNEQTLRFMDARSSTNQRDNADSSLNCCLNLIFLM